MPLELFDTDKDVTRLIQYQDTVYKIKILYDDNNVIKSSCAARITHNQIEQVLRAALYMDQRDTDFESLKPVITSHFIIKILKKYWKVSEKISFKRNGRMLKTFDHYFEFHVKARVDRITNDHENPESRGSVTGSQESANGESIAESDSAEGEGSGHQNFVQENISTKANKCDKKLMNSSPKGREIIDPQQVKSVSHKKKSNHKDTETDSKQVQPEVKNTRRNSQLFSAGESSRKDRDCQENRVHSNHTVTPQRTPDSREKSPSETPSPQSKPRQKKDKDRRKSLDYSCNSSQESDTQQRKRQTRSSGLSQREKSRRGYVESFSDTQTDCSRTESDSGNSTESESEYQPSPEPQHNKQRRKSKWMPGTRGKIDVESDSDVNSPVTRSRKKVLKKGITNKANVSTNEDERSPSAKGQNLRVKKLKSSRRISMRNRQQKKAKEEDQVDVDNILGVSYKIKKFRAKLAKNQQKELYASPRKRSHRLYNPADQPMTFLPEVVDNSSPAQNTRAQFKSSRGIGFDKKSFSAKETQSSHISDAPDSMQVKKAKLYSKSSKEQVTPGSHVSDKTEHIQVKKAKLNSKSSNGKEIPGSCDSETTCLGPIQVKKAKLVGKQNFQNKGKAEIVVTSNTEHASGNSTPVSRYIKNLPNDTPGSDRQLRSRKNNNSPVISESRKRKSSGIWNFVESVLTPIKRLMGAGSGSD